MEMCYDASLWTQTKWNFLCRSHLVWSHWSSLAIYPNIQEPIKIYQTYLSATYHTSYQLIASLSIIQKTNHNCLYAYSRQSQYEDSQPLKRIECGKLKVSFCAPCSVNWQFAICSICCIKLSGSFSYWQPSVTLNTGLWSFIKSGSIGFL